MSNDRARILVVDDEEDVLKIIRKRLELEGFEVLIAIDGEEALLKARTTRPHLIVLDLMLPKRNGFDVCTTLKHDPATSSIPIILFTGKGLYGDARQAEQCGAELLLPKTPVTARLVSHICALLAKYGLPGTTDTPSRASP